jgi:hypothetical protein
LAQKSAKKSRGLSQIPGILIISDGAKKTRRSVFAGCACIWRWLKQFLASSVSDDQNTGIWLRPDENSQHQKDLSISIFTHIHSEFF